VVVIDRPGAVQTEVRVGNIALPRKHPDYLALDLALKILGGEGGNRLHRVLRSERGLTYGASADMTALKDTGHLVADTDTRSDSTGEVLRLIVDEMSRLQRQRVRPQELADAQAYLTGSFPLKIETPSAIALQVLNGVFYGLDLDELQTYRERVNAVTPDDIQRVAREYLRPDRLSIVLVGDASVFARQLPGVGFDHFDRIPLSDLDLNTTDLRRPAATPSGRDESALPPEGGSDAPPYRGARLRPAAFGFAYQAPDARELIDRAVRAKGGLTRLRSIRTVRVDATTSIQSDQGTVQVPTTTWIRYPDAFRVDAEMPVGLVTQVLAGGDFWIRDSRGARQAPEAVAAEMRTTAQRDSIPLLLALADGRLSARRTAVDTNGTAAPALELDTPGMRLTVIFDPQTTLVSSQRYVLRGAGGTWAAEEIFSDYRSVDGIQVAFKAVVDRPGAPRVERQVRSFAYNVALDPALFTRPG
jgi:hypothetical protein